MLPLEAEQIARLVDRHGAALRALAAQWSDSPEDLVQEAFCRLVQQRQPPDQPGAWLFSRRSKSRARDTSSGAEATAARGARGGDRAA